MKKTLARNLRRQDLEQPIQIIDGKTYSGILRHFTQARDGVHVFITSSDNAVIVCSIRLDPDREITFTSRNETTT